MADEALQRSGPQPNGDPPLRLSELLLLAFLWMIFGFMLWYYLAAFHGAPTRIAADAILGSLLGGDFSRIVPQPDQHFLFQVETAIAFTFRDGSTEALGFIVNPLVFSYGLPLLSLTGLAGVILLAAAGGRAQGRGLWLLAATGLLCVRALRGAGDDRPVAAGLVAGLVCIGVLAAGLLPDSLIEVETAWLAQLTAPINSVAGVAGLVFLVAFRFFWKLRS